MSTYIDKMFINIISSQLEKFVWKKETLANCRCPICGDSQKHKNKARGFFFQKGNDFFYKCHNCNFSSNLYNFLEQISPNVCKEYAIQRWKNGENNKSNYKKPKIKFEKPLFKTKLDCIAISKLDDQHPCKKYVLSRKLPIESLDYLLYTDDFSSVAKIIDSEKTNIPKEPRLIIPIYNEDNILIGVQGRYIGSNKKAIRYITLKRKDTDRLWYGLNRVKDEPVYIVEGPIDSLFLPNGIATLGMDSNIELPKELQHKKIVFVLDNQPRNKTVVKTLMEFINKNYNVVVWPSTIKEKDINDMILSGKTQQEIIDIINKNTYNGLQATLQLNQWKKV